MACVWLFFRQIPLAVLPFTVYSIFHVLTYTRANILPTINPPAAPASPSAKPKASALSDSIGNFVKNYYDQSMTLVAALEILLWFRILGSAILFQKGSWILFVVYTAFFRARHAQSSFVQNAVATGTARLDATFANQSTPPAVRQGWDTIKGFTKQAHDATDLKKYVGGGGQQGAGVKKAQ
jgi:transmembrane protein 33